MQQRLQAMMNGTPEQQQQARLYLQRQRQQAAAAAAARNSGVHPGAQQQRPPSAGGVPGGPGSPQLAAGQGQLMPPGSSPTLQPGGLQQQLPMQAGRMGAPGQSPSLQGQFQPGAPLQQQQQRPPGQMQQAGRPGMAAPRAGAPLQPGQLPPQQRPPLMQQPGQMPPVSGAPAGYQVRDCASHAAAHVHVIPDGKQQAVHFDPKAACSGPPEQTCALRKVCCRRWWHGYRITHLLRSMLDPMQRGTLLQAPPQQGGPQVVGASLQRSNSRAMPAVQPGQAPMVRPGQPGVPPGQQMQHLPPASGAPPPAGSQPPQQQQQRRQ